MSSLTDVSVVEHLSANLCILALLACVDHLILKPYLLPIVGKKAISPTRWFFIHAFVNFLVVLTSLRSIFAVLNDPLHSMDPATHPDRSIWGSASRWPLTLINSVHVYHMLGGFRLTSADYFHHAMFIPTLGFPGQVFNWGALGPWLGFFISGFPGGTDYFMLGLVKVGKLEKLKEKHINANLNTWCRSPGIVIASVLFCQATRYGFYDTNIPFPIVLLYVFLPAYNGLYYGRQAVVNYAVHHIADHIIEKASKPMYRVPVDGAASGPDKDKHTPLPLKIRTRTSVSTGAEVIDWKRIIRELGEVPQRGS